MLVDDIKTSKVKASVGRVVHAYCPDLWSGPRPAVVVNGPWGGDDYQMVNCNVLLDGLNDEKALHRVRMSKSGNTMASLHLFDPLTGEERELLAKEGGKSNQFALDDHPGAVYVAWAEWPLRG